MHKVNLPCTLLLSFRFKSIWRVERNFLFFTFFQICAQRVAVTSMVCSNRHPNNFRVFHLDLNQKKGFYLHLISRDSVQYCTWENHSNLVWQSFLNKKKLFPRRNRRPMKIYLPRQHIALSLYIFNFDIYIAIHYIHLSIEITQDSTKIPMLARLIVDGCTQCDFEDQRTGLVFDS